MLQADVDDHAVRIWLDALPAKVIDRLTTAIESLTNRLRSHIVQDKLMGQVLHRRTGALGQSIQVAPIQRNASGVTGQVYSSSDVVYGRIHEYGDVFQRRVTEAWGHKVKNPRDVTFHYPERSFMRSSLSDMREEIIAEIRNAVAEGLKS